MLIYNFYTGMQGSDNYSVIHVEITESASQDVTTLRKLCNVVNKMLNRTEDYISYLTQVGPHNLDEDVYDYKSDRLFTDGSEDF